MEASTCIEKSSSDHREYQHVVLANGLRAMLISDSKCDKAAAALSVRVGSIFDPRDVQGLAHFCEHMLFLGTEKYPEENSYHAFLAKHGGESNAYTANCLTNYYFSVGPDHLEEALDRFSQFFKAPLFTDSATDREMCAVDSEHSKNLQSDTWRFLQLLLNDVNEDHPLHHFGTGNLETLKVLPEKQGFVLRERLLEFHSEYYSANIMCLAVAGKQSLSELAILVKEMFSSVPDKGIDIPRGPELAKGLTAFSVGAEGWPRQVLVRPVKELRSASFQFVLPQQLPKAWRTRPTRYLSFTIGHEGNGSLLSVLKKHSLATELMAGCSLDEVGTCIFETTCQLTEHGETQIGMVGELLFTYIRLLQQLPPSEELFHQIQCIDEMNFRFKPLTNSICTVSSLSHQMQNALPVDKILSGPSKVWEFDPVGIKEAASYLTCDNLRLQLSSKRWTENDCGQCDHWYGTQHGSGPLKETWHVAWEARRSGCGENAKDATVAAEAMGLKLPELNPFIAEDLSCKPQPEEGVGMYPHLIAPFSPGFLPYLSTSLEGAELSTDAGGSVRVFFRQDDVFKLPKATVSIQFYCPWTAQNLENRVITSAWTKIVVEDLIELAYDAQEAGLHYSLSATARGFALCLDGYHHRLPTLCRCIAEHMVRFREEVSEHIFGLVHSMMIRNSRDAAKKSQPYALAQEWTSRALVSNGTTYQEMLEIVEQLKVESLRGVGRQLLDCFYAEALVQGNFTESEVGTLFEILFSVVKLRNAPAVIPTTGVARLARVVAQNEITNHSCGPAIKRQRMSPGCVLCSVDGTNPQETNSAVVLTLQVAEDTIENAAFVELVAQVLGQRCFDQLRTSEQLGYIVALNPYSNIYDGAFCGLVITVQSEKHPAEVHKRINAWLASALQSLLDEQDMTEESFGEYHQALLVLKREKPKCLAEEFTRNWLEVDRRTFRFSRLEETLLFLEQPRTELLALFRSFVLDAVVPAPRFCTQVLGAAAKAAGATKPDVGDATCRVVCHLQSLGDVDSFRAGLQWCMSNESIPAA